MSDFATKFPRLEGLMQIHYEFMFQGHHAHSREDLTQRLDLPPDWTWEQLAERCAAGDLDASALHDAIHAGLSDQPMTHQGGGATQTFRCGCGATVGLTLEVGAVVVTPGREML